MSKHERELTMSDMLGNLEPRKMQGPMKDLQEKLAGPEGRDWLRALKRFLRKENPWARRGLELLRFVDQIEFVHAKPINPSESFVSRKGLLVRKEFVDRILPEAWSVEDVSDTTIASFDLIHEGNDAEICAALPAGHVFENTNIFRVCLAEMISREPSSEKELLTDGSMNLFYVRGKRGMVFVVGACKYSNEEWRVNAFLVSNAQWPPGCRVFSYDY